MWPDTTKALDVIAEIKELPPLVTSGEVAALKSQLAEAARGERFVLHGGDCAGALRIADRRRSQIN